jgi:hypothetical protein
MKTKLFVLLMLNAFGFSCEEGASIDPLKKDLIGTSWAVERIEIFDLADELIKTIEITGSIECPTSYLNFQNKDYAYAENCGWVGCGEWQVNENKITFLIVFVVNAYQGSCSSQNVRVSFYVNDKIELNNDSLMIEGWGATLGQGDQDPEWEDIRQAFIAGQVRIKTYYSQAGHDLLYEPPCCKTLSWI